MASGPAGMQIRAAKSAGNRSIGSIRENVAITDTVTHLAHHRGQLTLYLRLNDVPVASIYGPTADDRSFR